MRTAMVASVGFLVATVSCDGGERDFDPQGAGTSGAGQDRGGNGGSSGGAVGGSGNDSAGASGGETSNEAGAAGSGATGTDGGQGGASLGGAGLGGAGPGCGDGTIDDGEECDDAGDNGPGQACNADCQLNVCGDGDVGPDEGCDDGVENGFELLRCAPDCSRVIEYKHILLAEMDLLDGDLDPDPVATADGQCPVGYKAMFAYGATRRATTQPNTVTNPVDWPVQPYTYYANENEAPVWMTDHVALLGVREGTFVGLENSISLFTIVTATGLNADWTTLVDENCEGWSLGTNSFEKRYGFAYSEGIDFIYSSVATACDGNLSFYCVEQ